MVQGGAGWYSQCHLTESSNKTASRVHRTLEFMECTEFMERTEHWTRGWTREDTTKAGRWCREVVQDDAGWYREVVQGAGRCREEVKRDLGEEVEQRHEQNQTEQDYHASNNTGERCPDSIACITHTMLYIQYVSCIMTTKERQRYNKVAYRCEGTSPWLTHTGARAPPRG